VVDAQAIAWSVAGSSAFPQLHHAAVLIVLKHVHAACEVRPTMGVGLKEDSLAMVAVGRLETLAGGLLGSSHTVPLHCCWRDGGGQAALGAHSDCPAVFRALIYPACMLEQLVCRDLQGLGYTAEFACPHNLPQRSVWWTHTPHGGTATLLLARMHLHLLSSHAPPCLHITTFATVVCIRKGTAWPASSSWCRCAANVSRCAFGTCGLTTGCCWHVANM
jgi:hypothetical protein